MVRVIRLQHTSIPMPPGASDQARRFYGGILGMDEKAPPSTVGNELVWFAAGPDGHEVHLFADSEPRATAAQHLCLQVDDIQALQENLEKAGVEIEETEPITNRPRFFVHDPFDNLIELTQITGDYDSFIPTQRDGKDRV